MSFAALRPGDYKVYAFETAGVNMPSVLPNVDSLKPFEGRSKTVTVPENGRATVEVTAIPLSETGAATEPAQNGAKGSLAGKVVNAINGSPIAGATVTLRGQFSAGAPPQGTSAATDDQGRFTFPSLAPGSYSLMPVAPRFIRPANGASVNQERVIVGEGQQVSAYVVRMAPAGVIAGTVKDESGQPVLGAQVSAFRYRNDLPYRRLLAAGNARTDDLGQYRMATLAPGDYYVSVAPARAPRTNVVLADTADIPVAEPLEPSSGPTPVAASSAPETIAGPLPSEAESGYVRMWYPSAAQPSAATAVRLASGATVDNIDMTWGKTSVVRIRGKVTDSAGAVIVTPLVTLTPKNSDIPTASIVGVTVARDGSFEIASVPAGSYLLIARPGAATAGLTGPVVSAGGAAPVRLAVQEIDVKDSSIDGVKLVLTAGRMVKGTLKMEDGSPVPRNCCFSLLSMEGGAPSATIAIAADGTLTVNHVFPLTYTLGFQNLPANCYVKSIRYRGTDVSPTAFAFTGDGQLDVVLSGAAAGPLPVRIGSADSHGNFYFANLPPGDYRVLAWDNSAREASDPPQSLTPFARYAKTVTLGAGAHEKVQLAVAPSGR
jgi:protocatechuate 3,4-dioxygenase beta subunit